MTKPPRAVNVLRVARVNEELHTIAVVNPRVAAPRRLLLPAHRHIDRNPLLVPSKPYICKRLLPAQLRKTRQSMPVIELDPTRRPPRVRVNARRRKAKQHRRRD